VNSILESNYDNFEIILIDNGSTPENYAALQSNIARDDRLSVKRIEGNIGYVGGVNFGLKRQTESLEPRSGSLTVLFANPSSEKNNSSL